jgi:flagellar protein FlgJ
MGQDPGLSAASESLSSRMDAAQSAMESQKVAADAASVQDLGAQARTQAGAAGARPVGTVDPKEMARLRSVSQDFESLFLSYMMKVGRESGMKGGFWGQTEGEQIFTDMRDDELAKHMAKAGGIGLSKLLVEQLTRTLQMQANRQAQAQAAQQPE